ncbi:MAG: ABC transporter substrate-binding protein [Thermoanaerobacterales bacterium]|nr:ABC transporter substrate-binding protein [Thermoanaerobacterales bacterium]
MRAKRTFGVVSLAVAALLAACGDGSSDAEGASAPAEEADAPERIVSVSPSLTETLYAVGAGDQVVAVDEYSTWPEDAPVTDLSGYEPNVEAIASYDPDLVVASDLPPEVVDGLEALDIEVYQGPAAATLEEVFAQIEEVGEVTGHAEEAADLVDEMRAEIDEILQEVPEREVRPTYYHELDDTLYTVTSQTFIGELYALAGLENVADAADPNGEFGGYPQLSREFLLEADPDFIFLADAQCCGQDAETLAARPGFADLAAVREGRVVELDEDVASRWGPRVVDLLRTIVDATASYAP